MADRFFACVNLGFISFGTHNASMPNQGHGKWNLSCGFIIYFVLIYVNNSFSTNNLCDEMEL